MTCANCNFGKLMNGGVCPHGRATHPRWKALEVIEWAEKYQERRAA